MSKIALITPKFFGYEKIIIEELVKKGYDVDFIPENILETSKLYKLFSLIPEVKSLMIDNYFIKRLKKQYDIIFIIKGYYLSTKVLDYLKEYYPKAKMYMYQWDSVKNNPNSLKVSKYCEKCFTFDMDDAKKFNWRYRPLFFFQESKRTDKRKYDISFICSLHSKRIKIYKYIRKMFRDKRLYLYLYSPRYNYYKQKYLKQNKTYIGVQDNNIRFKSLSVFVANEVMANSNIIVDYTHPDQNGLTMRTCESIGHRCKLITNNKNVRNMNFYNTNNVYIYSEEDINIPEEFMLSQYSELPEHIYSYYSIEYWLKEILN